MNVLKIYKSARKIYLEVLDIYKILSYFLFKTFINLFIFLLRIILFNARLFILYTRIYFQQIFCFLQELASFLTFLSKSNFKKKIKLSFPDKYSLRLLVCLKIIVINSFLFLALVSSLITYYTIIYTLPEPENLSNYRPKQTSYMYDKNGNLLLKTFENENRTLVTLDKVPNDLINAVIAIEDKSFYHHYGISVPGLIRAAYANYKNQDITQGGSTITQQLIKNTLLTPERTFERKAKEMILAILLEKRYTKDQILEMYLNTVCFGGTSCGVQEASMAYFGKDVSKLDLAESSLLAGLPPAPSRYNPYINLEVSKERQKAVLIQMVEEKYISTEDAVAAYSENLDIKLPVNTVKYPHFVYYVTEYLQAKYGSELVNNGGLKIFTSLEPEIQDMAQEIVSAEVSKIANLKISNGASLITRNQSGEIVAMVGSKDYYAKDIDGYVNVTTSLRQPGSGIKPFNYSLALQNGMTAATIINDDKVVYRTSGSPPYIPRNYDGKFRGKVSVRRALANSLNIPSVKVLAKNGVQNFINYVREFGISTWTNDYYGLSLALGAGEVKMLEMNQAYSVFANDGEKININPILYILTSEGDVLEYNPCLESKEFLRGKRVIYKPGNCTSKIIESENTYIIKSILSDFKARAEAFGTNSVLNVAGTAVKTGTTNNLVDNWTFGFNKEYTVSAWVGNNDSSHMSYVASGITGASPIWAKIISNITRVDNKLDLSEVPENLTRVELCPLTYQRACDKCNGIYEYFIRGTEPKNKCDDDSIEKTRDKSENKKV